MRNTFLKSIIEEFTVVDQDCKKRWATVRYRDGVFESCQFTTEKPSYTEDDWLFLYSVGDLIRRTAIDKRVKI